MNFKFYYIKYVYKISRVTPKRTKRMQRKCWNWGWGNRINQFKIRKQRRKKKQRKQKNQDEYY